MLLKVYKNIQKFPEIFLRFKDSRFQNLCGIPRDSKQVVRDSSSCRTPSGKSLLSIICYRRKHRFASRILVKTTVGEKKLSAILYDFLPILGLPRWLTSSEFNHTEYVNSLLIATVVWGTLGNHSWRTKTRFFEPEILPKMLLKQSY